MSASRLTAADTTAPVHLGWRTPKALTGHGAVDSIYYAVEAMDFVPTIRHEPRFDPPVAPWYATPWALAGALVLAAVALTIFLRWLQVEEIEREWEP